MTGKAVFGRPGERGGGASLWSAMSHVPAPPCDTCTQEARCGRESLACADFTRYVSVAGRYRAAPGRVPSRGRYLSLFPGEAPPRKARPKTPPAVDARPDGRKGNGRSNRAVLTDDQVRTIRARYEAGGGRPGKHGKVTMASLAVEYGVHRRTIRNIVRGISFAHLGEGERR